MILFDLRCSHGHEFEAWFRDNKSFEQLSKVGKITCAVCGDDKVEKALMAPNVRTRKAMAPPIIDGTAKEEKEASGKQSTDVDTTEDAAPSSAAVATKTAMEPANQSSAFPEKVVEAMKMLRQAQTFIEKNFDPVGRNFAEEARKIHYGEAEKRSIYGEATKEEAETLADEGIDVNQMPWLPSRDS